MKVYPCHDRCPPAMVVRTEKAYIVDLDSGDLLAWLDQISNSYFLSKSGYLLII